MTAFGAPIAISSAACPAIEPNSFKRPGFLPLSDVPPVPEPLPAPAFELAPAPAFELPPEPVPAPAFELPPEPLPPFAPLPAPAPEPPVAGSFCFG